MVREVDLVVLDGATVPQSNGCAVLGCTGNLLDGYCDVCGSPAGAVPVPRGGAAVSSVRLAWRALGSERVGPARPRRAFTVAARVRGRRLGAGLTTVPPTLVDDPTTAVMADPVVPEQRRVCSVCRNLVGQGRDGVAGRTDGFCPTCGARFDFRPALAPGDLVGGQYQVVGCLAYGGQGWIYLARDRNLADRWVVLKGLLNSGDRDAVAAAIAERWFLARVDHPLIVQIYNFVTFGGAGYIVMEYVGGKTLRQVLAERWQAAGRADPLPVDQALAYVLEILPAFSHLHERGLLYCDFKPDNLVCLGDTVKLIDLGGVRHVGDTVATLFGTVGYQAPEVSTEGPSVASDVFTIGRVLATLVLDFKGNTTTYATTLPPLDEHPVLARYDSFYRLLLRACAPDPDDRFVSVDELRVQMLGVLREVVAIDRGLGAPARGTTGSLLFTPLTVDVADRPLRAAELPALRSDEHDPMHAWLSGIAVDDPVAWFTILAQAPQTTPEVLVARAAMAGVVAVAADDQTAAGVWWGRSESALEHLLDLDPWDWRAAWLSGLAELTRGEVLAARASFNAVYGQVPGEPAPKLALAVACELSGELDLAESLYLVCAATDATYTSPAAFGLARIRRRRRDLGGAVAALDLVRPTRASYAQAQAARAQLAWAVNSGAALVDYRSRRPSTADEVAAVCARIVVDQQYWHEPVRMSGIDWRVLEVQVDASGDRRRALLLADRVIGTGPYHPTQVPVTWPGCDLRRWLNDESLFLGSLGVPLVSRILQAEVCNGPNPAWARGGDKNTTDRVFLLSMEEAASFLALAGKKVQWKRYRYSRSVDGLAAVDEAGTPTGWWLRSPGGRPDHAAYVDAEGNLDGYGGSVPSPVGVRPAFWMVL
ncbi:MAG: serine/threonine-protein kinase PknG [Micrococcales bacterium]|nr:serine/threonine-protein kinase PknG [Micrococcales bacterium]